MPPPSVFKGIPAGPPQIVWDNKFDFAERGGEKITPGTDASGNVPWVSAPGTSHLERFRFYDARLPEMGFLRKFLGGRSQIEIRFKASGRRPVTDYMYFFTDHDLGAAIFDELVNAAHPGEVVRQRLIGGGIPYQRIS